MKPQRGCTWWVGAALLAGSGALACGPRSPTTTPPIATDSARSSFENPGGMWMPSQLGDHAKTLTDLGVQLPDGALTDPTAFPLGAVVSLGGCSASFVSNRGLVVTNHHCATGYLSANSVPGANLLQDGYLAKTKTDEKPGGARARIFVTQSFEDVTGKVLAGTKAITDDVERAAAIATQKATIEAECDAKDPATSCEVASYFDGAQYFEIERLEIRDIRLVYAPHHGIGVFGGDIDNWRWPRHTGDYAFVRAYVGPDGRPADPSPNNVPYQPKHFLKVAADPLQPGDFVMVAGYPGRTYRLKTAAEVQEAVSWLYPRDIVRYDETIAVLDALAKSDPELEIKAASQLKRLRNYRTNFQGMIDGLREGGLAAQKGALEAKLQAWIDADPERKKTYGTVLADMAAASAKLAATREHDAAVNELRRAGDLLGAAESVVGLARVREALGADHALVKAATAEVEASLSAMNERFDPALDVALLSLAAARATALPAGERPDAVLAAFFGAAVWKAILAARDPAAQRSLVTSTVGAMIAKTKLSEAKTRLAAAATLDRPGLNKTRDPLLLAARDMAPTLEAVEHREAEHDGAMARLRPLYVQALREFSTTPLAPDANGTLRITYGTVRGYKPSADAELYAPFSTVAQMVAKHTGEDPFAAPGPLLAAVQRGQWGPYGVAELGGLPLDFLADLDITGGNSGSATLNAKGELVGLAFDGNYESIASDWLFSTKVARSIHVDIRYVLWIMDAVDDADHLLVEMGVTPSIPAPGGAPTTASPASP